MINIESDGNRDGWTEEDYKLEQLSIKTEQYIKRSMEKVLQATKSEGYPSGMVAMALVGEAVSFALKNGWDQTAIKHRVEALMETEDPRYQERPDQWAHSVTHITGETSAYDL